MDNKNRSKTLSGKKVLVLGGSAGIGLATARAAASEGASVAIVSGNRQRLDAALAQLPAGAEAYVVNLGEEEPIKEFFANVGDFDHLVYTAGEALKIANIGDVPVAEARQYFNIRYWGAFTAVKYGASHIRKGGSIVLTSGAAGIRPGKGWALGASMCRAIEALTKVMALELAPTRVNIVIPGLVKTDLWAFMPEADRDAMFGHVATTLPVQYVAGPEDIAKTYLHLMQQPYITGQSVVVDGGYVLV